MNTSHLPRHEYTYTPPPTPEERLAAAAPELLAALRDCNGVLDSINRELGGKSVAVRAVLDKARAAIARAEGGGK